MKATDLIKIIKDVYDVDVHDVHDYQFKASAEIGDGTWLFDYWSENYDLYDFGIYNDVNELIQHHGYYVEWENPGTVIITQE